MPENPSTGNQVVVNVDGSGDVTHPTSIPHCNGNMPENPSAGNQVVVNVDGSGDVTQF